MAVRAPFWPARPSPMVGSKFRVWKMKPPGPEQIELERMFATKEIDGTATADSVRNPKERFREFSAQVFATHFRQTRVKFDFAATIPPEMGNIPELGSTKSIGKSAKELEWEENHPEPPECEIAFESPPFSTWVYTDFERKIDFVCVALPIISGGRDVDFTISEDGMSIEIVYTWPRAVFNATVLFQEAIKKKQLSLSTFNSVEENDEIEWNNAKPYSSIPGPSKFGLLRSFMPGGAYHNLNFLDVKKALYANYGSIFKLPGMFGKPDFVFTFDPKDMETIFRNEGQWPSRRSIQTFGYYRNKVRPDIFKKGAGLGNDQGETWAKLRTAANPIMMKPKVVKAYIPDIDTVAKDFIRKIKTLRDEKNEMPDDFQNELNKWSLESIAVIALEHRLGLLTREDDPENQMLINAVKDFFKLSFELDFLPSIWKYYKTQKFNRLMNALEAITNLSIKHIDRAIERLASQTARNESHEDSVLQKILQVDKDYAVVMALDMLLAGTDTTAAAISSLLYNLARHQKAQDKLREEIMTLLPNVDAPLTPESLNTLPYMRACLKESMRMNPIVGGNLRAAGRDLVLQGYQIPKGTDCSMGSVILSKDENFVERADDFIPERFLKEVQSGCPNSKDIHPFLLLPFGFGARACIGKRFAEMEIEVLTIRLLREFKIEWNYGPMTFANGLIITPASKLKYKVTDL